MAACRPSCTASSLAASRAVLASNHVLDCATRCTRARAAASQRGSTERSAAWLGLGLEVGIGLGLGVA